MDCELFFLKVYYNMSDIRSIRINVFKSTQCLGYHVDALPLGNNPDPSRFKYGCLMCTQYKSYHIELFMVVVWPVVSAHAYYF